MEKVKVKIQNSKYERVLFQENVIMVKKCLSVEDISIITASCLEAYLDKENHKLIPTKTDIIGLEITKSIGIFRMATNIDVDDKDLDVMELVSSGLIQEVRSKISNIFILDIIIEKTIADKREEIFGVAGAMELLTSELKKLPNINDEQSKVISDTLKKLSNK